jgi:hypothetical protein
VTVEAGITSQCLICLLETMAADAMTVVLHAIAALEKGNQVKAIDLLRSYRDAH